MLYVSSTSPSNLIDPSSQTLLEKFSKSIDWMNRIILQAVAILMSKTGHIIYAFQLQTTNFETNISDHESLKTLHVAKNHPQA